MEVLILMADPVEYRFHFINSKFVELRSGEKLEIRMQYPVLGMEYAEEKCFVRREVADMLDQAMGLLPAGMKFRIWDAWRPLLLQRELYYRYKDTIIRQFHLEGKDPGQQDQFISRYVSLPVSDHRLAPLHATGGALDLTLTDSSGRELPMGTGFDAFTERTQTNWYETHTDDEDDSTSDPEETDSPSDPEETGSHAGEAADDLTIRDNRRLLYHIMTDAGFVNLESEWWHYEYGDRHWAEVTGSPVLYSGVFTREEMDEVGYEEQ